MLILTTQVDTNVVSSRFSAGGATTEYAMRASGQVKSGGGYTTQVDVGAAQLLKRLELGRMV